MIKVLVFVATLWIGPQAVYQGASMLDGDGKPFTEESCTKAVKEATEHLEQTKPSEDAGFAVTCQYMDVNVKAGSI